MRDSDEELIENYKKAVQMSTTPNIVRLKEGYITDEEKSVKWNKEQVEISLKMYSEETKRLKLIKQKDVEKASNDIIEVIVEYFSIGEKKKLSKDGAKRIFEQVLSDIDYEYYNFWITLETYNKIWKIDR